MKYLKKYQMFFEDEGGAASAGNACVNASSVAGMGAVVNSQPGALPGTTGTSGSGDVSFGLGKKKERKKGKPNQVTDLRDLKEEETNSVDESTGYDLATECLELYHWLCEDKVDKEKLDSDIKEITNGEGWYSLDEETLYKLVNLLKDYNKKNFSKGIDNINKVFSKSKE